MAVGASVGVAVGASVGVAVGASVGALVGVVVGAAVVVVVVVVVVVTWHEVLLAALVVPVGHAGQDPMGGSVLPSWNVPAAQGKQVSTTPTKSMYPPGQEGP